MCGSLACFLQTCVLPLYLLVMLIAEKSDLLIPDFGCVGMQTFPSEILQMLSSVEICLFYDGDK